MKVLKTICWVSFLVLELLAVGLVSVVIVRNANAHETTKVVNNQPLGWTYPWACCSNMDCQRVSDLAIQERFEGYVITSTGEVVPYADKRVKDSPDGDFHWCAHKAGLDAGRTICLYRPPRGF